MEVPIPRQAAEVRLALVNHVMVAVADQYIGESGRVRVFLETCLCLFPCFKGGHDKWGSTGLEMIDEITQGLMLTG